MYHPIFFLCFGSGLLVLTFGQDELPGDVNIKNCRSDENTIDIREKQNNTLLCEGFNDRDTIVWFIQRNNTPERTPVATCGPSNCTVHQPDHFAVQRSPSHSLLFYQQYDRHLHTLAKVICESQLADKKRTKSCTLNVINPATLSDCAVETDTTSRTATGSCRVQEAFSHSRPYSCTWYLEKENDETRTVTGNFAFTSTSSPDFTSGSETFTVSSTGQGIVSSAAATSTVFEDLADEKEYEEKPSPVAAIVGGCIGGVVVIVAAVVIIAIVVKCRDATYAKPRRRQAPEHVYDGLHTTNNSTTTSTTSNTTPASETTIGDHHNIALNDTQNKEKTRKAYHSPVYVNEEQPDGATGAVCYNQVTQGYSGVQQDSTYYVNDNSQAAHDYCNGDHNSSPYYSEIKD